MSDTVVLEHGVPLSRSRLWQLQRDFFVRERIGAWSAGTVPHYIANNAFVARSYAEVLLGWLRDLVAAAASGAAPPLDRTQPIYIVELGAGSGRLAFHLMRQLFARLDQSQLASLPVTYVMTDFSDGTIDFWREHPQLRRFVAAGRLDFARFDADDVDGERTLELRESGVTLRAETLRNPLGVVANYFFDSVRQDAFVIRDGRLYESLVTLLAPAPVEDPHDPALLRSLEVAFAPRPLDDDAYYDDPAFNRLLADCRARLPSTHLLFPIGALRCLRALTALAGRRLFVVAGDKGYHHESDLAFRDVPVLTRHGSFSLMVNFHLLGRYVAAAGGQMLATAHRHTSLDVCALAFDTLAAPWVETRQAFASAVEERGPDDFFLLKTALGELHGQFDLPQLLAYLRSSGWDSRLFHDCLPSLLARIDGVSAELAAEVAAAARLTWDNYFHIGETRDVAFALGLVSFGIGRYDDAAEYLRASLALHGDDPATLFNLGMCEYELRRLDAALDAFDRALALSPELDAAREMRAAVTGEQRSPG